jgi:hypothetical protein
VTRYDEVPGHPLAGVPQEVLDVARRVLNDAANYDREVDPNVCDPMADAVVMALREASYLNWESVVLSTDAVFDCPVCDEPLPLSRDTVSVVRWIATRQQNVLTKIVCARCWDKPDRESLVLAFQLAQHMWETTTFDTGKSLAETIVDQIVMPLLRHYRE